MTTPAPDLADLESRPLRYWKIDGLPELAMGAVWMFWGVAFLVGDRLPRGSAYWLFMPAVLCLSGVAANWVVNRLKERITFPRAGYVGMREPTRAVRIGTAAIAVVAAMVLAALAVRARADGVEGMVSPIFGVLVSLAFLVASVRMRAPSFAALAGVALALGLAFGALRMGWESLNYLFVALGAACAGVGLIRLGVFLKRHPLERAA